MLRARRMAVMMAVVALAACQNETPSTGSLPTGARLQQGLAAWPSDAQWVSLKRGGTALGDPAGDSSGATGSFHDLQGTELAPASSVYATASQVFFRVRLGTTPVSASTLATSAWGCLLDTDGRANTYEYLVAVNGAAPGGAQVELWRNATTATLDAPADPAETLVTRYSALTDNVVGTTLAHARVASAGTSLGGGSDTFLDFAIDQADFQAAGLTAATSIRVLCGSSSSSSALDDDVTGTGTSLSAQLSDPLSIGIDGVSTYSALCPSGLACFLMPAMAPAPPQATQNYAVLGGGDMVFASPTGAATVTYVLGGVAGTTTLSVAAGGAQRVALTGGSWGFATAPGVAESRGAFVTSTQHDLLAEQRYTPLYWQSSSTIKASTVALGTRFRVAGYSLNRGSNDGSGWDYLSFYAPYRTTITVTAPSSAPVNIWNGASRTVTIDLAAGQTYLLESVGSTGTGAAPEIDGTLVTSTAPISVVVGGFGWSASMSAGDTGADGVVPVKYLGTDYVVSHFTATENEDVRVVADTDGTVVSVNGTQVATLAAGGTYKFVPTGVHNVQTSAPAAVFENTAYTGAEADLAFIPPIAFASQANVPSMSVTFNALGAGTVMVIVPAAQKGTVRLDGSSAGAVETAVPGRSDITTLKFAVSTIANHTISASSDLQVMFVAQGPVGGTGLVAYYNPYRRPGAGNGVLDASEQCDDGNVVDGDGCSSVAEIEPGFMCTQNGSGVSVCGCATDSACPAGQYCAAGSPNSCQPQLASGTAIPAQHGTCSAPGPIGSAATACTTGLCNATTNTCASGANVACTTASQCSTNSCVSNLCADTVVLGVTAGGISYTGGGPATPVDPTVTVTGTASITGASVSITGGFVAGQDVLGYTAVGSITGSYDATRGVLTLSGSGTLAQYQSVLRSVTYRNSSATPSTGTRTISLSLGTALSNPANGHFYEYVSSSGTWTQANTAAQGRSYLGLHGYLSSITTAAENAFITAKLTSDGWIGAQATALAFPRSWYWSGGPENGTTFCTNNSAGVWATVNGLYANWASQEPNNYPPSGEGCGQIYFAQGGTWNDLPCTGTTLAGYVAEYGGSASDPVLAISGTRTVTVSFTATSLSGTAGTLSYTQGSGAVAVDPGVSAAGTTVYGSATVAIVGGLVTAEDSLAMPTTNGLSASYASGTGVLTLTGTGTTADYQAAFRAVTYANSVSPRPTTALRSVRFTLGSVTSTRSLQVLALPLVTVSSSSASVPPGTSVTFTATLTPLASTGSVTFHADGASLGSAALSSGVASLSTASLALGTHTITASYGGDSQRLAATSASYSQTVAQLANGQGPCTAGNQATVCASGTCNTTTGTCGAATGGACSAANQCANNVCGSNGQCGYANGQTGCTSSTASLCQSGVCSADNATCIPTGGCAITADCASGYLCNSGTQACELAPGITTSAGTTGYDALGAAVAVDPAISVVGQNPITGATVTVGSGYQSGDQLAFVNQGGITGSYDGTKGVLTLTGSASSAAYQTALASVTYSSSAGAVPSTAPRTITFAIGTGVAYQATGHFYEYVSGGSWTWSQAQAAAAARRYYGMQGYLATIGSAAENAYVSAKLAGAGWMGAASTSTAGLPSFPRTWSWVTGPETGTAFCSNTASGTCSAIAGAYANWNGGEPNNAGDEYRAQFLANGLWNDLSNTATLPGYVVEYGGMVGDPVLTLSASKTLQVRAATSVAVASSANPSVYASAVHFTATLTPASATGTVQFSVDGAASGAPVAVSGGAATSADLSGLAVGTHVVTAAYAGDTADQPATGTLAGGQSVIQLANGQGPCTLANQATVCASGTCNTTTGTCGGPPGGACASAGECANDICGSNGQCGYANGQTGCTEDTALLCQSGVCSADNATCIPAGGCAITADCAAGNLCNAGTQACELAPGITTSAGTTGYDALGAAVAVDPAISVVGQNPITSATVTVGSGYQSGDQLAFVNQGGITGSYDAQKGILTLTGSASAATYQAALASVTYSSTAGATPSTAPRTVTFAIGTGVAYQATGHFYEYVSGGSWTWSQAQAAAAARTYYGMRGYLVTIGGAAENAYVSAKLAGAGWMGAASTSTAGLPSFPRTWSWVTGPETGTAFCSNTASGTCSAIGGAYTDWNAGEPNNVGDEYRAQFLASGLWNDLPDTSSLPGYVVEYGGMAGDPVLTLTASKTLQVRAATSVAVASSTNPSLRFAGVRFTASLTPAAATGTVQFAVDGVALGAPVAVSAGAATSASVSSLTVGTHTVTAAYAGDVADQAASGTLAGGQVVQPLANGQGPCTAASAATDCVAGVCSPSGETCGYLADEGPCTAATAAAVCQSGVCSQGGVCLASASACYVDADCAAARYCERSSHTCQADLAAGAPIPSDGLHDGTCSAGNAAATCLSGECNTATSTCAAAPGATCASAAQCTTNACAPSGRCVPAASGSCWADGDCAAGLYCDHAAWTCTARLAAGVPLPVDGLHDGTCSPASGAAVCASGVCNASANTCAGPVGASCTSSSECQYGTCSEGTCGISDGQPGCTAGTAYLCQSGTCSVSGTCVSATPGACWVDADCGGSQYCDRATARCVARVATGASLPADGLHDGVCTAELATAVCQSGSCNRVTNTCALANGQACTGAAQCVTDVCGSNHLCGQAAGDGPCTVDGGVASCQSGLCDPAASGATSACIPSVDSCWVDAECAAGTFCLRTIFTCVPTAGPGTPLPGDGLHPGCPDNGVNAACATGRCNPQTATCAAANGADCTSAAQCVSNACGSNGKCGLADGQTGCGLAGGTACQSGTCAPSGACVPAGGCWADGDCATGQYCDRAAATCRAKASAGGALPSDGLHAGVCTAQAAAAACATGLCNPTTSTCASANGQACTGAAQCATDACGVNGLCGLASGQAGCTAATAGLCQSGQCSGGGVCVPRAYGSCWDDADCGAAQHCRRDTFTCVDDGLPGTALPLDTLHQGVCSPAAAQAVCASGECNPVANTCASANGVSCTAASQCAANACGSNGKCGLADGQTGCTAASASSCQSGTCAAGTCVPASGCWTDADCGAGTFCRRDQGVCQAQAPAGAAIPDDGLHDAQCSAAVAQVVCASGTCNPVTSTCAAANGESCAAASECSSNTCGPDGKCGLADGEACTSSVACRGSCEQGVCVTPAPTAPVACGCAEGAGAGNLTWLALAAIALASRRRLARRARA